MKPTFCLSFALVILIVFKPGLVAAGQRSGDKPNIIFILADDLGWGDVGFKTKRKAHYK